MCGIGEMADTAILGVAAERHKSSSLLSRTILGEVSLTGKLGPLHGLLPGSNPGLSTKPGKTSTRVVLLVPATCGHALLM